MHVVIRYQNHRQVNQLAKQSGFCVKRAARVRMAVEQKEAA